MKARLAYPFDEFSGKTGGDFGIVLSNWRGLQVARRLVIPRNPNTSEQAIIRGFLTVAAGAFQSVTASEKSAWESFAEIMASRILGQRVVRPAISEYVRVNVLRQMDGQATTDTAPTSKPDTAFVSIDGVDLNTITGDLTIDATLPASITAGTLVLFKYTSALPSGVVVPRVSDYRTAEGVNGAGTIQAAVAGSNTYTFTAPWFEPGPGDFLGVAVQPLTASYAPGIILRSVVAATNTP